jgi:hypothetical protein
MHKLKRVDLALLLGPSLSTLRNSCENVSNKLLSLVIVHAAAVNNVKVSSPKYVGQYEIPG